MDETMIEVQKMTKSYGEVRALDGVDLAVGQGARFALLGPNGAGKSTLTRILCSLACPDGGSARVAGEDVLMASGRIRARIGVALQELALDPDAQVRSQLVFQCRLFGMEKNAAWTRAEELLECFGLAEHAGRCARDLSGGTKRRLHVALALAHRPSVLFLDEFNMRLRCRNGGGCALGGRKAHEGKGRSADPRTGPETMKRLASKEGLLKVFATPVPISVRSSRRLGEESPFGIEPDGVRVDARGLGDLGGSQGFLHAWESRLAVQVASALYLPAMASCCADPCRKLSHLFKKKRERRNSLRRHSEKGFVTMNAATMQISTAQLVLRPFSAELVRAAQSGDLADYRMADVLPDPQWPEKDLREALPFFAEQIAHNGIDGFGPWVVLDGSGTVVGSVGFLGRPENGAVEVGFGIVPSQRRKGYCLEALEGLLRWDGFLESGVTVTARCEAGNAASAATLRKAGFLLVGETDGLLEWRR